ncbi:MAG: hypothetical protein KGI54_14185 [Pseudomonadota bacterium]|nr:hypothetical protein [Pseudomonadota bacterium]
MELSYNTKLTITEVAKKHIEKLIERGYHADQIAEFITRPGHIHKIIMQAQELHVLCFDKILEDES